jgi:hypothetical protein
LGRSLAAGVVRLGLDAELGCEAGVPFAGLVAGPSGAEVVASVAGIDSAFAASLAVVKPSASLTGAAPDEPESTAPTTTTTGAASIVWAVTAVAAAACARSLPNEFEEVGPSGKNVEGWSVSAIG